MAATATELPVEEDKEEEEEGQLIEWLVNGLDFYRFWKLLLKRIHLQLLRCNFEKWPPLLQPPRRVD